MRWKTKDERAAHFFGDFSTLNSKNKRAKARKRHKALQKAAEMERKRIVKEKNKILYKEQKRRRLEEKTRTDNR